MKELNNLWYFSVLYVEINCKRQCQILITLLYKNKRLREFCEPCWVLLGGFLVSCKKITNTATFTRTTTCVTREIMKIVNKSRNWEATLHFTSGNKLYMEVTNILTPHTNNDKSCLERAWEMWFFFGGGGREGTSSCLH